MYDTDNEPNQHVMAQSILKICILMYSSSRIYAEYAIVLITIVPDLTSLAHQVCSDNSTNTCNILDDNAAGHTQSVSGAVNSADALVKTTYLTHFKSQALKKSNT